MNVHTISINPWRKSQITKNWFYFSLLFSCRSATDRRQEQKAAEGRFYQVVTPPRLAYTHWSSGIRNIFNSLIFITMIFKHNTKEYEKKIYAFLGYSLSECSCMPTVELQKHVTRFKTLQVACHNWFFKFFHFFFGKIFNVIP